MRKIFCGLFIVMGFCCPALGLEFSPPIIVNQGTGGWNEQPSLVTDNSNNIYASWTNLNDSSRVYFGVSSDMGLTWTTPSIRVNNESGIWYRVNPSLKLDSSRNIYITWTHWIYAAFPSIAPLLCSVSFDGGYTWSEYQVDDGGSGAKMYSCLIIDQYDTLYAIWHDERISYMCSHPYFAKSIDGINWLPVPNVRVDSSFYIDTHSYDPPRMVIDNAGVLHAVFHHSFDYHIFSTRSTDGGLTWSPCIDVSGAGVQGYPDIACDSDDMLYVVWRRGPSTAHVYFSKSTNGGLSWSDTLRLATDSDCPKIAVDENGNIYALWVSQSDFKLYLSVSENSGNTWSSPTQVCDTISAHLDQCAISLHVTPDGLICVAWDDETNVYFSLADNGLPQVTVLYPNGGEVLGIGDTCSITWTAEDNVGIDSITILCSIDAGMSWDTIATGESNDSLYEWVIPNTPSDSCLVKILAYDPSFNIGEDQSDSFFSIGPSGIEENILSPTSLVLFQVSPNPFSKLTEISFGIGDIQMQDARSKKQDISLKIYDVGGRIVKVFNLTSGLLLLASTVSWDGSDNFGKQLPSGVYFCRLIAGDYHATQKILRLK